MTLAAVHFVLISIDLKQVVDADHTAKEPIWMIGHLLIRSLRYWGFCCTVNWPQLRWLEEPSVCYIQSEPNKFHHHRFIKLVTAHSFLLLRIQTWNLQFSNINSRSPSQKLHHYTDKRFLYWFDAQRPARRYTSVKQRDMDYILYTTNASASIFIFYSAHQFSLWTVESTKLYKCLSDQRAVRKYQMHLNSISRRVRIRLYQAVSGLTGFSPPPRSSAAALCAFTCGMLDLRDPSPCLSRLPSPPCPPTDPVPECQSARGNLISIVTSWTLRFLL